MSRVYPTLEEAIAGRDAYLESVKNESNEVSHSISINTNGVETS